MTVNQTKSGSGAMRRTASPTAPREYASANRIMARAAPSGEHPPWTPPASAVTTTSGAARALADDVEGPELQAARPATDSREIAADPAIALRVSIRSPPRPLERFRRPEAARRPAAGPPDTSLELGRALGRCR